MKNDKRGVRKRVFWFVTVCICVLLVISVYLFVPRCSTHERNKQERVEKPQQFPANQRIDKLLKCYVKYQRTLNYDKLIGLYASNVELYTLLYNSYYSQTNLSQQDIRLHYEQFIAHFGCTRIELNINDNTTIVQQISSTTARVSFMAQMILIKESEKRTSQTVFIQMIFDETYHILSEVWEPYDDSEAKRKHWDYSRGLNPENLHDRIADDSPTDCKVGEIHVPAETSIQEAVYRANPDIQRHERKYGVGGAKVLGETCADAQGIHDSWCYDDITINILPLYQIKFVKVEQPNYIYNLICNNYLTFISCEIEESYTYSSTFLVSIDVYNPTDKPVEVEVPNGSIIEAVDEGVQNVVVSKGTKVLVHPRQTETIQVGAECAAKQRSGPSGSKGRVTPYALTSPSGNSYTKQNVWIHQASRPKHKVVFYAYKAGTVVFGEESKTGHAFVYVPDIGYVGFGTKHKVSDYKKVVGTDGSVFGHDRYIPYVTDQCAIMVTDEQLEKIQNIVKQYMLNPPPYRLGRYDCTSFVMDVADAAGVYYGNRAGIQTPIGFLEQLHKYNYLRE